MQAKDLKFLYIFKNSLRNDYYLEVKRTDLSSELNPNLLYFWFNIIDDYIFRYRFIDGGKLASGKDIRILKHEDEHPFIFIFKDELVIHQTAWDPNSGKNNKLMTKDLPKKIVDIILNYFNKL